MPETTRPLHIGFRLSAAEKQRIQAAAKTAEVPVGTFCREGALEKVGPKPSARIEVSLKVKRGAPGCLCGKRGRPKVSCPFHGVEAAPPADQERSRSPAASLPRVPGAIPVGATTTPGSLGSFIPPPPIPIDHPEFVDLRTQQLRDQGMTTLAAKRQARKEQKKR